MQPAAGWEMNPEISAHPPAGAEDAKALPPAGNRPPRTSAALRSGPASNYPPPSSEDLSGEDMNLRLETVGLYRGLSFVRGAEHSATTRSYILKILENMQARAECLKKPQTGTLPNP